MNEIKLAVDSCVFTVKNDNLMILLIKRKKEPFADSYALPGGFVEDNEEIEDAVKRELLEETNVSDIFLKQLKTYGKIGRDPRGRVVSIAFLALIHSNRELVATSDAKAAEWHDIRTLPKLAFDHSKIIEDALSELRLEIQTTNIACQILPEKFTLSSLQKLYELVLGKKLDKRNFRKKLKELDILNETDEKYMDGAHRPALLYQFKNKKFQSISDKIRVFL